MIPGARPRGSSEFPFLDITLLVLAAYAILAVAFPDNPLRPILALAAFFSMGYATLALVVAGSIRLTAAEVLAFTVGFTVLITAGSALGVSVIGIPITQFAVIIIGLPVGVLSWLFRRPRIKSSAALAAFVRSYFDFSDYSRAEKGIAAVLFVAVLLVLVGYVALSAIHYPSSLSPAIALTGPDGSPDSLNTTVVVGASQTVTVTVLGGEAGPSFNLVIRLVPRNATGSETFTQTTDKSPLRLTPFVFYEEPLSVGPAAEWSESYTIIIDAPGLYWLRFELEDSLSAVVTENHFPVMAS